MGLFSLVQHPKELILFCLLFIVFCFLYLLIRFSKFFLLSCFSYDTIILRIFITFWIITECLNCFHIDFGSYMWIFFHLFSGILDFLVKPNYHSLIYYVNNISFELIYVFPIWITLSHSNWWSHHCSLKTQNLFLKTNLIIQ